MYYTSRQNTFKTIIVCVDCWVNEPTPPRTSPIPSRWTPWLYCGFFFDIPIVDIFPTITVGQHKPFVAVAGKQDGILGKVARIKQGIQRIQKHYERHCGFVRTEPIAHLVGTGASGWFGGKSMSGVGLQRRLFAETSRTNATLLREEICQKNLEFLSRNRV